jgi:hypothetical protein
MSITSTGLQIDLRQAVKTAIRFFTDSFHLEKPVNVQLEEIEMSEDGFHWLITVGYDQLNSTLTKPLKFMVPTVVSRKYKIVKVDAQTGRPVSIKIRPGL